MFTRVHAQIAHHNACRPTVIQFYKYGPYLLKWSWKTFFCKNKYENLEMSYRSRKRRNCNCENE
jgi:hypothetical protein